MQHVEVYLEPFFIVTFEQPVAQVEVALPALAAFAVWTINFSSNQVTDISRAVIAVFEWRLGNEKGRTTAHRKSSQTLSLRIVRNVNLLGHLDNHVDTHTTVGHDTKSRMERRHRDELSGTEPEHFGV